MIGSDLTDIAAEYAAQTIGPLIYTEACAAVAATRRYRPSRRSEGVEDLDQGFITDVLLAGGQLAYAIKTATELEHFRALLRLQAGRYHAERRTVTVVDNLMQRCRTLLMGQEWRQEGTYFLRSDAPRPKPRVRGRRAQVLHAAALVAAMPKRRERGEQAPSIWGEPQLEVVLKVCGDELGGFTLGELREILARVLTDWVPSVLEGDESLKHAASADLGPADEVAVRETVDAVMHELDDRQRIVLTAKLANLSDAVAARRAGISRPTAADAKARAYDVVRNHVGQLPHPLHEVAIEQISLALLESS